jgi:hypothetical protein
VEQGAGEKFITPNTVPQRILGDITPEQFDHMAQQVAWGRPVRDFASGAGTGPLRKALQARASQFWIDHNVSPEIAKSYVQKYGAQQAGARTLAIQEARLTNAIQEVKGTAQQVLDISDRIPRTRYPALNNVILAWKKGTGDEDVVRLGTATETLINDYAATLGRGNNQLTDNARQHARELLERGYSQGQMRATVDQMRIEIDRAAASIRKGMDIYLGITKEEPYRPLPSGGAAKPGATTAPAPTVSPGSRVGERKQFKQGWGVWNGKDWVAE